MATADPSSDEEECQPEFEFHIQHGKGIELTNNRKTARKINEFLEGVVMSSQPMDTNLLYAVEIDEIDEETNIDEAVVGVVTESPSDIDLAPSSWRLESAVFVTPTAICDNTVEVVTGSTDFAELQNVRKGSCVGVVLDDNYILHVVLDGHDVGVVNPNKPLTTGSLHAMFDLVKRVKKVTARPLTRMAPVYES